MNYRRRDLEKVYKKLAKDAQVHATTQFANHFGMLDESLKLSRTNKPELQVTDPDDPNFGAFYFMIGYDEL